MSDLRHSEGLRTTSAGAARLSTQQIIAMQPPDKQFEYQVGDWMKHLTRDQKDSIRKYTGSWSHPEHLVERGINRGQAADDMSANFRAALEKAPVRTEKAYRGMPELTEAEADEKFKVGNIHTLDVHRSFTTSEKTAEEFAAPMTHDAGVILATKLPVVEIPRELSTSVDDEHEAIASPGTKIRITKVDKQASGYGGHRAVVYHVEGEYVGGGWDESKHPRDEDGKFTNA